MRNNKFQTGNYLQEETSFKKYFTGKVKTHLLMIFSSLRLFLIDHKEAIKLNLEYVIIVSSKHYQTTFI